MVTVLEGYTQNIRQKKKPVSIAPSGGRPFCQMTILMDFRLRIKLISVILIKKNFLRKIQFATLKIEEKRNHVNLIIFFLYFQIYHLFKTNKSTVRTTTPSVNKHSYELQFYYSYAVFFLKLSKNQNHYTLH